MKHSVTILGARGSIPVSGSEYLRYGGSTTCVLVRLGEQPIVLDAGTGLLKLPEDVLSLPRLSLLLTHPHADHLLGLPMCRYVARPGAQLDVYAAAHGGLDTRAQVCRLMSPPLWPVGPELLPADIRFHDLPSELELDGLLIHTLEGIHPGGVTLLRLEADGRSLVFISDCTILESFLPRLREFALDCDLLLCDGQYSDAEWTKRAGFGHSTWSAAAQLAQECRAKRLRIVHHDPQRTDAELDDAAKQIRPLGPDFAFAREEEVIEL